MRRSWKWLFFIVLIVTIQHCANPIAPTGGPRDETPPQLDTSLSTPNYQTNFKKQTIELTFDEWVNLQDVFNQVVVSPPLNTRPEVRIKKRTVLFEFAEDEVLREPVTYTINFGESIKDLTEGNSADNLRFVFSTGDFIDSLSIQGVIVDAKTGKPVEGVLFNMYDELQDSVVRTKRPFYFAKTNKEGRFRVENIKSDTFKLFALKDANLNYLFDQSTETIGFLDTFIILPRDLDQSIKLQVFTEEPLLALEDAKTNSFGLIRMGFSKQVPPLQVRSNVPGQTLIEEYKNDSLLIWYPEEVPESWELYVEYDTLLNDTVLVDSLVKATFMSSRSLKWSSARSGTRPQSINPGKPLRYELTHPVASVSSGLFVLTQDTSNKVIIPTISIDTNTLRTISINYPWKEGMPYRLEVLPGAVTDIYGLSLTDTLKQRLVGASKKDYGTLNLTITGIKADSNYVVDLLSGGGSTLVERIIISGKTEYSQVFQSLSPGKYQVLLTVDLNKNGRWDTGDYDLKLQPEPFFIQDVEQLRANWEIDSNIALNELLNN
jgi:hypothetical protein